MHTPSRTGPIALRYAARSVYRPIPIPPANNPKIALAWPPATDVIELSEPFSSSKGADGGSRPLVNTSLVPFDLDGSPANVGSYLYPIGNIQNLQFLRLSPYRRYSIAVPLDISEFPVVPDEWYYLSIDGTVDIRCFSTVDISDTDINDKDNVAFVSLESVPDDPAAFSYDPSFGFEICQALQGSPLRYEGAMGGNLAVSIPITSSTHQCVVTENPKYAYALRANNDFEPATRKYNSLDAKPTPADGYNITSAEEHPSAHNRYAAGRMPYIKQSVRAYNLHCTVRDCILYSNLGTGVIFFGFFIEAAAHSIEPLFITSVDAALSAHFYRSPIQSHDPLKA